MSKWILARTLTLVGILGVPFSNAAAKLPGSTDFKSEREAREYLQKHPEGPKAAAAFAALSELRSSTERAGLTREQIVDNFSAVQVAQSSSQQKFRLPSETSAQDLY